MAGLEPLVLPADVVVTPVADLSVDMRRRVDCERGDHCLTRPLTRTVSSVVDAQTAALLEHFRTPATIVDAVVGFAFASGLDPRATLDEAFDVLAALVNEGLLVPAASASAEPVAASLPAGTLVDDVEVVEPVHLLDDTEVYRARHAEGGAVALKIAGAAPTPNVIAAIQHEAAVLERMDGVVNPRLICTGIRNDRPFLVTAWHRGVDLYAASGDARSLPRREAHTELLALAERVVESYVQLHRQGVLHGDVQPRNALVDAYGAVTLLDFGLAGVPDAGMVQMRGGVDVFQSPEIAGARLTGAHQPPPSARSEQYAISALLYLVLTGGHTHPFSLLENEMLRQVVEDRPLPFSRHGVSDLPSVERCLLKGLAKDPTDRHESLAALRQAFREAADRDRSRASTPLRSDAPSREFVDRVLGGILAPGESWTQDLEPPTASVVYGGAGLAYALLRIARSRGDDKLLAQADLWGTRAALSVSRHDAFWNRDLDITPERFGRASLFHHAAGVHCVEALIAHARGDDGVQARATDSFIEASARCELLDVVFGRSGLLLGAAVLLEALPGHLESASLREFGHRTFIEIGSELETQPSLLEGPAPVTLGVAHGWSGYLFAILRWCEAVGVPPPGHVRERLSQLAALAEPCERGLAWPRRTGGPIEHSLLVSSWCNGAAGHVHLWTLAHRVLQDDEFDHLAELAAWTAYEGSTEAPGELCCGLAGRAYALLSRYKRSGDRRWLARARVLYERAARRPVGEAHRRDSLYHGDVGIALLAADLQEPEFAGMPLFEAEGWPRNTELPHTSLT